MNTPVPIETFLKLAKDFPIIDVRSPAEFQQGHIPGAYNIPLFDNEERAKVGIAYKQKGRQKAIKLGLDLVGPKLSSFITQVEEILNSRTIEQLNPDSNRETIELRTANCELPTVLIHCWRGGMRSENFAFLLNLYGYKTYTLIKGYKAYRNFVLSRAFRIEHEANIIILGGETGSGKTEILRKLAEYGEQIIDLEAMAHHKGSAFGSLGEEPQPTQEQFENNLAYELMKLHSLISSSTGENEGGRGMLGLWWLEDESRNIGKNQIPLPLWEIMKSAPLIRIYVPRESRIKRLVAEYGKFSKEELSECILKIQQRLGPQNAKLALEELGKGNLEKVADILLTYYDKAYQYDLEKRKQENIFTLNSETTDASVNAKKVIELVNKKFKKEYV